MGLNGASFGKVTPGVDAAKRPHTVAHAGPGLAFLDIPRRRLRGLPLAAGGRRGVAGLVGRLVVGPPDALVVDEDGGQGTRHTGLGGPHGGPCVGRVYSRSHLLGEAETSSETASPGKTQYNSVLLVPPVAGRPSLQPTSTKHLVLHV